MAHVPIGVFFGLQVDGWNDARNDRNRETEYLQRQDFARVGQGWIYIFANDK